MVTGAAGWLGSRLTRWLVGEARSLRVYALVRPGKARHRLRELGQAIEVVEADLNDDVATERVLARIRPSMCVHFAWYAVPGLYWSSDENLRSLEASIRLASRLGRLGCRRFVGIGTSAEYASRAQPLTESSPLASGSLYAASKRAFQILLEQIASSHGMSWLWARVFYQYGPEEDERRLVPMVIRNLLSGAPALLTPGTQARDFLHVDDVAGAIGTATFSGLEGIVNIGSGISTPVADVATTIGRLLGRPELIRLGARPAEPKEAPIVCADPTRLSQTGWRPTYNLETGLANTIDWFRRQHAPAVRGRSSGQQ